MTIQGDYDSTERRDLHQEEAGQGVRHAYKERIAAFSPGPLLYFVAALATRRAFCNMVLTVKLTLFLRLRKLAPWSHIRHDGFDMHLPILEGLPVERQQASGVPLPKLVVSNLNA